VLRGGRPQAAAARDTATPAHGARTLASPASDALRGTPVLAARIGKSELGAARGGVQRASGRRANGPVKVQSILGGLLKRDPTEKVRAASPQFGTWPPGSLAGAATSRPPSTQWSMSRAMGGGLACVRQTLRWGVVVVVALRAASWQRLPDARSAPSAWCFG